MKTMFSLPKNREFFNRYATLIPTLLKLGFIAQLLSALTEIGILYNLSYSRAANFIPHHAAKIAFVVAVLGTAFLEIGLRKFTPYSIQAILYKRFKGLDLAMSIFIFLVTFGLFFSSGVLSFKGSKELIEVWTPPPPSKTTTEKDKMYTYQKKEIFQNYSSDSLMICSNFDNEKKAQTIYFDNQVLEQQTKLQKYLTREKITGENFSTRKDQIKSKIKGIEVEKAQKIATIQQQKGAALTALLTDKKSYLNAKDSLYLLAINTIQKENKTNAVAIQKKTSTYGNGLAYFTIICLFVFLFSVVISEVNKKGSGIEQIAIPNQYDFLDTVLSEFLNVSRDKAQFHIRSRLQNWENKTPAPPLPSMPAPLLDIDHATQNIYNVGFEPQDTDTIILSNENDQIKSLKMMASKNGYNQIIKPNHKNSGLSSVEMKANTSDKKGVDMNAENAPLTHSTERVKNDTSEIESKILSYLKASIELAKCELLEQSKEMTLKAEDVIKSYLGKEATPENVQRLQNLVLGFLNGENENPFSHHHRQMIGFKNKGNLTLFDTVISESDKDKNEPIRKSYNDNRSCLNCGSPYTPNHKKQKYCKTKCRIEFYKKTTGKDVFFKKKK